ncbi:hypothetical protein AALB47_03360 [Lachnospiraceae bacterium 54-11]
MKEKLIKISKLLMLACMTWGAGIGVGFTSFFYFGEYAYPTEK